MKRVHFSWHRFLPGGCSYCGFHCDDCPPNVNTCKCRKVKEEKKEQHES